MKMVMDDMVRRRRKLAEAGVQLHFIPFGRWKFVLGGVRLSWVLDGQSRQWMRIEGRMSIMRKRWWLRTNEC
jgi:hypothetical protein